MKPSKYKPIMSKRRLILAALCDAHDWQDSLAEAWGEGTPEREKAKQRAADYMRIRREMGAPDPKQIEGNTISIYELARRAE